jgi:AraC family transcriptional activator of pobA
MKSADKISQYKFKPGLPQEIEIINIKDLFTKNLGKLTLPHRSDFYHIIWIEKGSPTHFVDFKPVKIPKNSILFIGRSKVHLFDSAGGFDGKIILFTDNFFCKNQDDIDFLHSTIVFNDLLETSPLKLDSIREDLSSLLALMENAIGNQQLTSRRDVLQNYLHNFLLLCDAEKRKHGFTEIPKGPNRDYAVLFISLVNEHFTKIKSVQLFADMIHISEKRLGRATAAVLGKSPKEIINDRVLLEIKRLLVHTNMPIKEIGFSLGFSEPTNFIKYFKQQTGSTPSEFREQWLQ